MELTIEQALQQGVAAHKEGKLEDAERLYRAILQSQSTHPDANHNLGVLAVSVGKADAALPLFKTALEANSKIEQFWLSYIDALIKEKQFDNAKAVLGQAKNQGVAGEKINFLETQLTSTAQVNEPKLAVQKKSLSFSEKRGKLAEQKKNKKKAKKQTLKGIGPSQEQLSSLLEHYQNRRFNDAEKLAVSITNEFPKHQFGWKMLGLVLEQTGRASESLVASQKSVQLAPQDAEAYYNLGITLKQLGRLEEAEASYTQAITLKPDFAEALCNRSHLLLDKGRFEAALRDADACVLKRASALPLKSLYALGRISEIYRRIEIQSKVDGEDISIAAFAAFISEAEKKPTAYNFCPNPIDFINVTNLSSHVNDSVSYVAGLIEELNKLKTIWEPSGKSTVSGFQSLNGMNLFKSPSGKIAQLKSIIINELEAYHLKFQNEQCSYIQKFPSINNIFGWNVILKQQGHQNSHIHTGGWLSGVIYLKVVPSLGKDEGAIEFSLNGDHYHDINSPNLTFQPEVGDIVFFPSSLHHRTIPFTTDADRIIVSFDLKPEAAKP